MAQTDLVCSSCVGRRTVNNIVMKVNSKVMVTTVPPSRPLAYTRRPIFVSASVHQCRWMLLCVCELNKICGNFLFRQFIKSPSVVLYPSSQVSRVRACLGSGTRAAERFALRLAMRRSLAVLGGFGSKTQQTNTFIVWSEEYFIVE
jgi:hypothetical protein